MQGSVITKSPMYFGIVGWTECFALAKLNGKCFTVVKF